MKTRIITAFIGFLLAIAAITLGGYVYDIVLTILALIGWNEICRMFSNKHVRMPLRYGQGAIIVTIAALSLGWYALAGGAVGLSLLALWLRFTFSAHRVNLADMTFSTFGLVYILVGMGSLLLIRSNTFMTTLTMPFEHEQWAVITLWLLLFTTWASDTFAYFAGVAFGKHKIVPHISPNKTAEGYAGGFVGCVITGIVFAYLVGIPYSMGGTVGILAGVLAPLGDLFESKLKRTCDVKDSGALLPGHGGVLDRFDSLFFTAPAVLLYILVVFAS